MTGIRAIRAILLFCTLWLCPLDGSDALAQDEDWEEVSIGNFSKNCLDAKKKIACNFTPVDRGRFLLTIRSDVCPLPGDTIALTFNKQKAVSVPQLNFGRASVDGCIISRSVHLLGRKKRYKIRATLTSTLNPSYFRIGIRRVCDPNEKKYNGVCTNLS